VEVLCNDIEFIVSDVIPEDSEDLIDGLKSIVKNVDFSQVSVSFSDFILESFSFYDEFGVSAAFYAIFFSKGFI
jgi:hypothetical protein